MRDNTTPNTLPATLVQNTTMFKTWAVTGEALATISGYASGADLESIIVGAFTNTLSLFMPPMVFPFSLLRLSESPTDSDVTIGYFDVGAQGRVLNYYNRKVIEYSIDMSTLTPENNFLDYEPYTTYFMYVPFIGDVPLKYKDIDGCRLLLRYYVDVLSGIALAEISAKKDNYDNIIFSHSCQLGVPVPMSESSVASDLLRGTLSSVVGGLSSMAGTSGAGKVTTTTERVSKRNPETGRLNVSEKTERQVSTSSTDTGSASAVASGLQNVLYQDSGTATLHGTASAVASFFTNTTPYIKRLRPNIVDVENYGHYNGYACMEETSLGDHTGYCEVYSVHLDGFGGATAEELAQIERLLKSGVIL